MRRACVQSISVSWRAYQIGASTGSRKSGYRGASGYDFAAVTERTDEPVVNIDWVASSITGYQVLYARQYFEPRPINVIALPDAGPSMSFATRTPEKAQLSMQILASVGLSSLEGEDRFASMIVNGPELPPLSFSLDARGVTSQLSSASTAYEGAQRSGTNDAQGFASALLSLPRAKSLVFIVSDFHTWTEKDTRALSAVAARHDVRCALVYDAREAELPYGRSGSYHLQNMSSGEMSTIWLNDSTRKRYRNNFQDHLARVTSCLAGCGCQWMAFSTKDTPRRISLSIDRLLGNAGNTRPGRFGGSDEI